MLHPASLLLWLCVGVLLTGITFRGSADSYTVTGEVPAPLPGSPATIDSPADQTHFTAKPVAITGHCPANSYVKLMRNNLFSGSAVCGPGQTAYRIATDLSLGSNLLIAQVYNITNQPGPPSSSITVFYDSPVKPPIPAPLPPTPPSGLGVLSADTSVYSAIKRLRVSSNPTITGIAWPRAHIVLTFHSAPLTCSTYADANGYWSCTLAQALPDGLHTVDISAVSPSGQTSSLTIKVEVIMQRPAPVTQPFVINSDFQYQVYRLGQTFNLSLNLTGGSPPYALTVGWGDGSESTVVRSDDSGFAVTHVYNHPLTARTYYVLKFRAVDSKGASASLQTVAIVNPAAASAAVCGRQQTAGRPNDAFAASLSCEAASGVSPSLLTTAKEWLWVIWPTYAVVVLMALSFWLGERQEYYHFFSRRASRSRRR